jgi:nitrogen fixation protein NifB
LASPDLTLATLDLLRQSHPDLPRTLVTLGLGGAELAESLRAHGLKTIALQVAAIDPEVLCRLYAWIRPGSRTIAIVEAAQILASEQARTVMACKAAGMAVNIRTTLYPGVNENQVAAIAARMAELGADSLTVAPYQSGSGTENCLASPSPAMLRAAQELAATWLAPADDLPELVSANAPQSLSAAATPRPSRQRPNLAVVSSNGREVDLHLGEAAYLLIYGPREDGLVGLFGTRPAPKAGSGKGRWRTLAETLNDCFAILTVSAGDNPRRILGAQGITVLTGEGEVDGMVDALFGGGKKGK